MANDKRFVTKNGLHSQNILMVDDVCNPSNSIEISMDSTDTISFIGDSGQLFSVTDSLSGTIFAVNDISGIPSIEVDDDGTIRFAENTGNVLIGTATDNGTDKVQISGSLSVTSYKAGTTAVIDSSGNWVGNDLDWGSQITGKPTTLSGYGITDGATTSYVTTQISNLVASAPTTLDTLNELAAALGDDPNFATTVTNSIATKAASSITISAGGGLTGGGNLTANRTISHADTSTATNLSASGRRYVTGLTFDTYGHVTGYTTGTETVTDTNTTDWRVANSAGTQQFAVSAAEQVRFAGGGTTNVSFDAATQTITINSIDTNTDTNNYVNGLSFNTSDGILTATRLGLTNLTVDLDGRYALSGHTHTYDNYLQWFARDHDGTQYSVTSQDTLVFAEGAGMDVNFTADDILTFTNTDRGSQQNIFKNVTVTDTNSGHAWASTGTIVADSNNDTLTFVDGGGIDISASTGTDAILIQHTDTSSQASVNNSGRTYIQDITLDAYGHVTGINSATETVVNTDTTDWRVANSAGTEQFAVSAAEQVRFAGSGATSVAFNATTQTITISSTDTDTNTWRPIHDTPVDGATTTSISSNWAFDNVKTPVPSGAVFTDTNTTNFNIQANGGTQVNISAGEEINFVNGSGTTAVVTNQANPTVTFNHNDTSTQASVNNSGGIVIQDVTLDGFGHVTGLGTVNLDSRYLQSYTETDTLADVTSRGNTTITACSFTNTTASTSKTTGAVIITGGLGVGGDVWATNFNGTASAAKYSDLAERYETDGANEAGTIMVFGGEKEITSSTKFAQTKVAGVISTEPAVMMNSDAGSDETHPYIALQGRVPCKVVGKVRKGDIIVASNYPGVGQSWANEDSDPRMTAYVGIAIEDKNTEGEGLIEVKVGK